MADTFAQMARRAVDPSKVKAVGTLTEPRSYGVYQLPYASSGSSRFHFGNHPIRVQELEREFGTCTLTFLFEAREDAENVARALNGREI